MTKQDLEQLKRRWGLQYPAVNGPWVRPKKKD